MVLSCTQMSNRKPSKIEITKAVLAQLPDEANTPLQTLITTWWATKSGDSLRLSNLGDQKFREAEIEFFDLPLHVKHDKWYRFIVDCGKLKCPFYISVNKKSKSAESEPYIRLYDSKIAVLISLYGDIHSYLDSIKTRK